MVRLFFAAYLDEGVCKREVKSTRDRITAHSWCMRLNISIGPQSIRSVANDTSLQAKPTPGSEKTSKENLCQCPSMTNELRQVVDNHDYLIFHSFTT